MANRSATELVNYLIEKGYVTETSPGMYRPTSEPPESEGEEICGLWKYLRDERVKRLIGFSDLPPPPAL